MKKCINFKRTAVVLAGLVACGFLYLPAASAEDKTPPQQINLQFNGVIPASSTGTIITDFPAPTAGTSTTDQPTRSGGFQASYSYQFNRWAGADASYGWSRFTQNYSGAFGAASVQSNMRQLATDFILHIPDHSSRIHPYAVAGVGSLRFSPTDNLNNLFGSVSETRSAFIYGGGADIDVSKRIGIRADYRGFRLKAPDFRQVELTTEAQTHIAEPSIGVYFRFSKVSLPRKGHSGN